MPSKHRPEWRGITRPAQAPRGRPGTARGPRLRPVFDGRVAAALLLRKSFQKPTTSLMPKSDLQRSHDELRAALRVAGADIRNLNFGRSDTPVLQLLRRVLRDARAIAQLERQKS